VRMGHEVTYLIKAGSSCPFANVLTINDKLPLSEQIPDDCDVVHMHFETKEELPKPHITTLHGNIFEPHTFHQNTVFISYNHAHRHGGSVYVHNGIDFDDYGKPELENRRLYFHFLGNAAWRVKNVRGAIDLAGRAGERLHVIGGTRVNFRMGLRITLTPHVRFHGMLGGDGKNAIINGSKGLIFPVLWHEPFGLAIVESLYFGCPVFGTPYGSLPEILGKKEFTERKKNTWNGMVDAFYSEFGCLSVKKSELVDAIKNAGAFDPRRCHEHALEHFSAERMAKDYLKLYEQVLNGKPLHKEAPALLEAPPDKLLTMKE
ncbi:MAG: glycosyltransferase, partial [Saprospiraceae bacterium]